MQTFQVSLKNIYGKQKIDWDFEDNWGRVFEGTYRGEVVNKKPHGLGCWTRNYSYMHQNLVIEGEWRNGKLHGKAIKIDANGRQQCEMKNGKMDGRCILQKENGDYAQIEYKGGSYHGIYKKFNKEKEEISRHVYKQGVVQKQNQK